MGKTLKKANNRSKAAAKKAPNRSAKPKASPAQVLLPVIERLAESIEHLAQAAEQVARATPRSMPTTEPQHPISVETSEALADLTAPRESSADMAVSADDEIKDTREEEQR